MRRHTERRPALQRKLSIGFAVVCVILVSGCWPAGKPTVTPTNTRVVSAANLHTAAVNTDLIAQPPAIHKPFALGYTIAPVRHGNGAPPVAVAKPARPAPPATSGLPPLSLRSQPSLALKDWPRPQRDNGIGIHFLPAQYADDKDVDYGINNMQRMGMRWALVIYSDEAYLQRIAPKFKAAGIMVVWRKMLRAYEPYFGWERDINLLKNLGMPPYMQVYNEPEVAEEWDGRPISQTLYYDNLLQASRDIYNAGGYVGWQFILQDWLQGAITSVKERQGEAMFGRLFFIPHPYGLNHPPDYTADQNGVLGFLPYAEIFRQQVGFVPPMIAGEGGWKFKGDDDRRYPPIDDARHRDFHVAVFNWFRSGILSNGQALPDYLFAFCPWLLLGGDASVWLNSMDGTRQSTIDAVTGLSNFVRRFSWDK